MRGEQAAAADAAGDILCDSPRDRQPIEGGCAAPDLVEQHQRAGSRSSEDVCHLDHLDHEGRAPSADVVVRTDPCEHPVHHADARPVSRNERTGLSQDGDERGLAQVGGFATHVRPGEHQEAAVGVE